VLYNLMFIAPLSVIFIFALTGVTSADFSRFLKKHMLLVKALMALLFFGLGIFLLWRYSG
jgi:predicted transporter